MGTYYNTEVYDGSIFGSTDFYCTVTIGDLSSGRVPVSVTVDAPTGEEQRNLEHFILLQRYDSSSGWYTIGERNPEYVSEYGPNNVEFTNIGTYGSALRAYVGFKYAAWDEPLVSPQIAG